VGACGAETAAILSSGSRSQCRRSGDVANVLESGKIARPAAKECRCVLHSAIGSSECLTRFQPSSSPGSQAERRD
jgi:hypothetical protein